MDFSLWELIGWGEGADVCVFHIWITDLNLALLGFSKVASWKGSHLENLDKVRKKVKP